MTIPKEECVIGQTYAIRSRNLIVGVWTGEGFVGIREKFDRRYLFTEYHYDDGPPFGTVTPERVLGPCPVEDLGEYLDLTCNCGRTVEWRVENRVYLDPTGKKEVPETEPGWWKQTGWDYHKDDGSRLPKPTTKEHSAVLTINQPLFDWLCPLDAAEEKIRMEEWALIEIAAEAERNG
jgi:hypothetical protein